MPNINHIYNWMPPYTKKGYEILDEEDFVFIKKNNNILDVFTSRVTEEELKRELSRLEKEVIEK